MLKKDQSRIIVLSGPSGTGKSTLIKNLLRQYKETLKFSISTTTRFPRPGEVHGVDYYFVSPELFMKQETEGYFLETANVHGYLYGTSKNTIEESLKQNLENRCLLDIDVQGAIAVSENYPYAKRIFVLPPSLEELEKRLRQRGDTEEKDVQLRLQNAIKELSFITAYNYFVVNNESQLAFKELEKIIYGQTS